MRATYSWTNPDLGAGFLLFDAVQKNTFGCPELVAT
jgi:hypothetical protein